MAGRKLLVFDSFEGLPQVLPEERVHFDAGAYAGTLDEVRANVQQYGDIAACEFIKGWFHETLPHARTPVVAAFVDVDARDSVKTCLEHLYPLLTPGGSIFSHDGHLPLCVSLMASPAFWHNIAAPAPRIYGLGKQKLVQIQKPQDGPTEL
jgi:O-methyltransferase